MTPLLSIGINQLMASTTGDVSLIPINDSKEKIIEEYDPQLFPFMKQRLNHEKTLTCWAFITSVHFPMHMFPLYRLLGNYVS